VGYIHLLSYQCLDGL
jgi:hypothetical protein